MACSLDHSAPGAPPEGLEQEARSAAAATQETVARFALGTAGECMRWLGGLLAVSRLELRQRAIDQSQLLISTKGDQSAGCDHSRVRRSSSWAAWRACARERAWLPSSR